MRVYSKKNPAALLPQAIHQLGYPPQHGQSKTLKLRDIASLASLTRRGSQVTQRSHLLYPDLSKELLDQSY